MLILGIIFVIVFWRILAKLANRSDNDCVSPLSYKYYERKRKK